MGITLRDYQKEAVDTLFEKAGSFLNESDIDNYKKVLLKSPTGSGKTVMMAKLIEHLALDGDEKFSFVWVSVRSLADQSKNKFEQYIGGGGITFSYLGEILDNEIKENEVLFFNWEKVSTKAGKDNPAKDIKKGDWSNVFMRKNERDRNLNIFCENTREAKRKIVLIVDESHARAKGRSKEIVSDIIKPSLRIDVTATPNDENYDYGNRDDEYIDLQRVKDAHIIKKEVIINPDITKTELSKSEESGDVLVFRKAIEWREKLEKLYKKEKSSVRPLVLVQLPNESDKMTVTDKKKVDWTEKHLDDQGINYDNKRLAKWLTGKDKINLENIEALDNQADFLIFKQAIALGWDCPRAHILVKFRETKSPTFEIQTVGRIMRMPEVDAKPKSYKNEILNRAYVFANLNEIDIDEKALEYIKTKKADRRSIYNDIDLNSIYLTRSEYNDLTYAYRKNFFDVFMAKIKGNLDTKKANSNFKKFTTQKDIDLDVKILSSSMIIDEEIKDIDDVKDIVADKDTKAKLSDENIEERFTEFLRSNCGSFQPARSIDKIRIAIYQTFEKYLDFPSNLKNLDGKDKLVWQKIVLKNEPFFRKIVIESIDKYSEDRTNKRRVYKPIPKWNVPEYDFYQKNAKEKPKYERCIMNPCFVITKWKTETDFIENYLEKARDIDWWYKNGDAQNEIYFAVPYKLKGKNRSFYPDFIVKYKGGKIGIFDTKKGKTATEPETEAKAEALQKYIKEQNKKGKKLFGGIVIPVKDDGKDWKLNQSTKYDYDKKKDWKFLDIK